MKTVHWQVPFQSYNGTAYRIDIYATGTVSTPEVLMGADGVFATDEDNNDDYFTPVRTQTGTLRLVDPDGTLMERLLPQNNLDHPLRLVNVQTGAVEWQGFLGCEAYSQQYTARPQELTLSVISVLEAMKSAELDPSMGTLMKIRNMLYTVLHHVETAGQGDLTMLGNVYYPADSFRILFKFIDTAALFDQREICNENSVRYEVQGMSAHDVLERLCRFMGWTAHEVGQDIYLTKPGKGLYYVTLAALNTTAPDSTYEQYVQQPATIQPTNMRSLTYKGDNHKKSITQGAKAVEVVAKVDIRNLNLKIPGFPSGNTATAKYKQLHTDYIYLLPSNQLQAYGDVNFSFWRANMRWYYGHIETSAATSLAQTLTYMYAGSNPTWDRARPNISTLYNFYTGAFHARVAFDDGQQTAHDTKDGIYAVFLPHTIEYNDSTGSFDFNPSNFDAIFSMDSVLSMRFPAGYINLNMAMNMLRATGYNESYVDHSDSINNTWKMMFELKFGTQYWNGTAWQNTRCQFVADMKKNNFVSNWDNTKGILETEGLLIPVNESMSGVIKFGLWPAISRTTYSSTDLPLEAFITRMDATYIPLQSVEASDRKENHYRKVLGLQFRDEVTIDCELASDLNNRPSPSLILNDSTHPMQRLTYTTASGNVDKRPEIELLERMERYYGANRRTVELEVQESPNPASVVTGYDNLQYTPVAVKHDWQEDKTTVTCMEAE